MNQIYDPKQAICQCEAVLIHKTELKEGKCFVCIEMIASSFPLLHIPPQIVKNNSEHDRTEERHPEETFSSDPPKVRNSPLSGKNSSVPRNSHEQLNETIVFLNYHGTVFIRLQEG